MEKRLKKIAAICAGFMMFVMGISVLLATEPDSTVLASNTISENDIHNTEETLIEQTETDIPDEQAADLNSLVQPTVAPDEPYIIMSQGVTLVEGSRWKELSGEFSGDIQIILPAVSADAVVSYDEDYVARTLDIRIDNFDYDMQDINNIQRIAAGKYYMGKHDALLQEDPIRKIEVNRHESDRYTGTFCTDIKLKLNGVYAYELHAFNDVLCIDVINPRNIYDNVIVLDAGHGGQDNGCSSTDNRYYEKHISLDIIKKLKKRLDKTDIRVYYTRTDDTGLALHQRVDVANALDADMFISVHCNYYRYYWVPGVNGAEALYSSVCKEQKNNSRKLADTILDSVTKATGIRKRGVINRKRDLHILRESKVPSTIIEVGYMSDKNDLKKLTSPKKVQKVADGIYKGIIKYYKDIYGKEL